MKILDLLQKNAMLLNLISEDKVSVLNELVVPVAKNINLNEVDIFNVLMERERLGSTGIGNGIAIPHCKLEGINRTIMGFGLSRKGVEFESIDGQLVYIFFLLITPEKAANIHLELLARLSQLLRKKSFKDMVIFVKKKQELIELIKENDNF